MAGENAYALAGAAGFERSFDGDIIAA